MVDPEHPCDCRETCNHERSGVYADPPCPAEQGQNDRCHAHHRSEVPQVRVEQRPEADIQSRPQSVEVRDDAVVSRVGPDRWKPVHGEPDPPWQHERESDEACREEASPQLTPVRERRHETRKQHTHREKHPLALRQHRPGEEHGHRCELPRLLLLDPQDEEERRECE